MRDDLHRTPALPRPWRAAVKHASKPADADRVAYSMSRATYMEMTAGLRADWFAALRTALDPSEGLLFPGQHRLEAIRCAERDARHPVEQQLCEVARGICAREPQVQGVTDKAMESVHRNMLSNSLEHAVADIRAEHGAYQGNLLRDSLRKHLPECNLALGSTKKPRAMSDEALLGMSMAIPVQ